MTRRQRSILRAAAGVFLLLLFCHWLLWLKYNRCSLRWWGWGYAFLDYFLLDQSRPMFWYSERGFRNVRLGMTREEALSLAGPPVTEYNLEEHMAKFADKMKPQALYEWAGTTNPVPGESHTDVLTFIPYTGSNEEFVRKRELYIRDGKVFRIHIY